MFRDESTFSVRPKKDKLRVWRFEEHRWLQRCTVPTFTFGYQTVSV